MSDRVPSDQLQAGDVLLYHGSGFISDMIRLFDGSDYSHAALYNGQAVVEAVGSGILARPLAQSVAGARYVDVYRFISADDHRKLGEPGYPAQPILDTAANYVNQAERYAYEQIVLLALLAGTRRLPLVSDIPFLRWMLRNILDNAAELVSKLVAAGKEPMICSELVYRCYTESGPQYDLVIRGADTLTLRARSLPALGGTAAATAASASHEAAAIQAELDTFMAKYQRAKHKTAATAASGAKAPKKGKSGAGAAVAAGGAALAVADFVTPRDLRDSPDLYKVGTLQA